MMECSEYFGKSYLDDLTNDAWNWYLGMDLQWNVQKGMELDEIVLLSFLEDSVLI
jgi:hypothetical protein